MVSAERFWAEGFHLCPMQASSFVAFVSNFVFCGQGAITVQLPISLSPMKLLRALVQVMLASSPAVYLSARNLQLPMGLPQGLSSTGMLALLYR